MLTRVLAVGAGPIASAMDIDGCGTGCGADCGACCSARCGACCAGGVAGTAAARALGGGDAAFVAAPREGSSAMATGASGTPRVDAGALSGFVEGDASAAATESDSGSGVIARVELGA